MEALAGDGLFDERWWEPHEGRGAGHRPRLRDRRLDYQQGKRRLSDQSTMT